MSTKIYNGYRIKNVKSLKDVHDNIINDFRKKSKEYCLNLLKERIAKDFVTDFDMSYLGNKIDKYYGFLGTERSTVEKDILYFLICGNVVGRFNHIEKSMHRDPIYDFGISLTLFPYNHSIYYIMLFTEQQYLLDLFKSYKDVEYYGYWDNTDGPDELSYQAWEARGSRWDKVLSQGIPARDGYTIDLIKDAFDFVYLDEFKKDDFKKEILSKINQLTSFDKRCYRIAKGRWEYKYMKENRKKDHDMECFFAAGKKLKEDPTLCNEELEEVKKILKPEITLSDFDITIEELSNLSKKI